MSTREEMGGPPVAPAERRDVWSTGGNWTEDALREWHTQNCPRISEREASCFACSLFELLSQARKRHVRYLEKIRAAIGDDRLRRYTGEPATSDANEIRRLIAERNRLRGIVEAVRLSCRNMRRNANLDDAPEVEDALSEIETHIGKQ